MKKIIFIVGITGLVLVSCGGLESDAKEFAKLDCELKSLTNPSKIIELSIKHEKMKKKFKLKYQDQYQEFEKAYKEAVKDCK